MQKSINRSFAQSSCTNPFSTIISAITAALRVVDKHSNFVTQQMPCCRSQQFSSQSCQKPMTDLLELQCPIQNSALKLKSISHVKTKCFTHVNILCNISVMNQSVCLKHEHSMLCSIRELFTYYTKNLNFLFIIPARNYSFLAIHENSG